MIALFCVIFVSAILDRFLTAALSAVFVLLFGSVFGRTFRLVFGLMSISLPLTGPYLQACHKNAKMRAHPYAALLCGTLRAATETSPSGEKMLHVVLATPESRVEDFLPHDDLLATQLLNPVTAHALVMSDTPDFEKFANVAEIYIPSKNRFLGRYPYVRRRKFQEISVHADGELRIDPVA